MSCSVSKLKFGQIKVIVHFHPVQFYKMLIMLLYKLVITRIVCYCQPLVKFGYLLLWREQTFRTAFLMLGVIFQRVYQFRVSHILNEVQLLSICLLNSSSFSRSLPGVGRIFLTTKAFFWFRLLTWILVDACVKAVSPRVLFVEGIHAVKPLLVEEVDYGLPPLVSSSQPKFTKERKIRRYFGTNRRTEITDYLVWTILVFSALFAVVTDIFFIHQRFWLSRRYLLKVVLINNHRNELISLKPVYTKTVKVSLIAG